MSDDCGSLKSASLKFPLSFWPKYLRSACFFKVIFIAAIAFSGVACSKAEHRSIPPEIESAIGTISDDIAAERYEKIYNEASDLWKQASTLEQSTAAFKTLATKLGKMENRTLHSATEQHNSSGLLSGLVFIVSYQTKFEKGEAMETFTLIEKDHQWQLARYFVNSTALN